jgi:hypothetical protein
MKFMLNILLLFFNSIQFKFIFNSLFNIQCLFHIQTY